MPSPLEQVGSLYIENQRLLGEYRKLLGLVQQLQNGEVRTGQVAVDMNQLSWSLIMTGSEFAKEMNLAETPVCEDEPV